jgi:DNA-binding winged helix-turn-helix (wHTH) protein/tetratricopeptide (TPR) repeat protein
MDRPVSLEARRIDLSVEARFKLGGASVDPPAHEITVGRVANRLQPQTLKVLVALHDRIGEVVTRRELIDRCWDGRIVGEDVINRCISLLRRIAEMGAFHIETIPRAGYRLIEGQAAPFEAKSDWWALTAGVAVIAAAGAYLLLGGRADPSRSSDEPTVAVMPIGVQSNDPALRDSAISVQGSISQALNSGGFPVTLVDASAARDPDLVVSGNISRTPAGIELLTEVAAKPDGIVLYSRTFDAGANGTRDVAEQAGAFVASKLAFAGGLMMLDRRHPSDPAITEKLLQQSGDGLQAYKVARALAAKSPDSVTAQLSLALDSAFVLGDLPSDERPGAVALGRRAAARALSIAPEFGDAYVTWCLLHGSVPLAVCEDHGRKALQVDPNAFLAPFLLSGLLDGVGRVDDSLRLAEQALATDPYNPSKVARVERILEETGDKREADEQFDRAMRWWPGDKSIPFNRLLGMEARGNYDEIARFAAEQSDPERPLDRTAANELFAARRSHDGRRALRACADNRLRGTNLSLCMTILADMGELDRSFAIATILYPPIGRTEQEKEKIWLEQQPAFAVAILSGPAARSMRRDARFLRLARDNGLLDYWASGRLPDFCRTRAEAVCAHFTRRS